MKRTPTELTLDRLRRHGWDADVVEQKIRAWDPVKKTEFTFTRDGFGCVDIVAVRPGRTLAIQACAACDVSKRVAKAVGRSVALTPSGKPKKPARLREILDAGWGFQVWGWSDAQWAGRTVYLCRRVKVELGPDGIFVETQEEP